MVSFWKNNSLTIVLTTLFLSFLIGQSLTGWQNYNQDQQEHSQQQVSYPEYLTTGNFIEAVFENWESEFLQMSAYVLLTVWLRQKGSAESKEVEEGEAHDDAPTEKSPLLSRYGGLPAKLYQNSLSLVFALLFIMSILLHAYGGAVETTQNNLAHGEASVAMWQYMTTAKFWFESFQNWQSEFMVMAVMVVLSIYLRQKGSPESKPVTAPNSKTGS